MAFLNSSDNGGEVIISEDHLGCRLGNSGSRTHGDTNFSLLEGRSVIDTISSHGSDLLHLLQIFYNLRLVEWFHTGEHAGVGTGCLLLGGGQIVKFTAREGKSISALILSKDSNPLANGFSSVLVVSGDHDDSDTSLLAKNDGGGNLHPGGVQHTNHSAEGEVDFIVDKLGRVVQVHVSWVHGGVSSGEAQAPESIPTSSVLNSSGHDLLPHLLSHGDLLGSNPGIGAPVENSLGCSLHKHLGSVSETSGLLGGAVRGHRLPVSGELKSVILLPLAFNVLANNLG